MDYLNRVAAPFPDDLWDDIDTQAVEAARVLLTARRFMEVEGPYGAGLTSVELGEDNWCPEGDDETAQAVIGRAVSVPMLRKAFTLSIRRLEAHHRMGQPLNFNPVQNAAEAVARREEAFVYYGHPQAGLQGLLTAEGRQQSGLGEWSEMDRALQDVLGAVDKLDKSGYAGPYALALAPPLYNTLFRRYEGSDVLQLEHLGRLCQLGVYKAPIEGGAVIDGRVGRIIVGQDLATGYSHQDGVHYHLYVSESVVPVLDEPAAVCVLG